MDIDQPINIIGLSGLINTGNDIDIRELEKEILHGGKSIVDEEANNIEEFKKDMERLTNIHNTNSNDDEPKMSTEVINSYKIDENIDDPQLKYMTVEEKNQTYVDNVLHDMNIDKGDKDIEFDIERESEEEEKSGLLEQIDMLRQTLEDDGVELGNIPKVDKNSSFSDIQNVYKILRLKNDRNRYCSFAEEMILTGAYAIEYLFDGKKEWFGRKPDLVGWNQTLKVKLKRCRYQTSSIVKDAMTEYNMTPMMQLAMEIAPSLFLYSRQKSHAGRDTLVQDSKYTEAISNLNSQM
jgi:hypothetical protein